MAQVGFTDCTAKYIVVHDPLDAQAPIIHGWLAGWLANGWSVDKSVMYSIMQYVSQFNSVLSVCLFICQSIKVEQTSRPIVG